MKKILLALCLVLTFNLMAADDCQDLTKCVEIASKLTGKKYLYDGKLKGELKTSSNLQITAENADIIFSAILSANGYSRVPTLEKGTYKIIDSRDTRYETLPNLAASLTTTPEMPQSEDYYLLTYQMTNFKDGQAREIANSLRPFMSRYGRVIETAGSNAILLQETASKIPTLLEIMRRGDRPYTKDDLAMKKERMEREEKREKMEAHEGKQEKRDHKKDEPKTETKDKK